MAEALQVCHLVSTFHPVIGGTQRATQQLCAELARQGARVVVLTRALPGVPCHDTVEGVPVHRAGWGGGGKLGALGFALAALWLLATRYQQLRIVHVQNVDTPLLVGLLARLLLRRSLVVTIHGEMMLDDPSRDSLLWRARLRLMRQAVDRFTALSPAMLAELSRRGVPHHRVRLIPNGIDVRAFRPATPAQKQRARAALGVPQQAGVLLFLGRLVEVKGVDVLLNAWAELGPGPCLLLVGDGPEAPRLRELAARLGIEEHVRFLGSRADVAAIMHSADGFILPSRMEGLSVALLEAMACGLAPVVSALAGNLALVRDGENGVVAPVGDAAAWAEAMRRVLQAHDLRRRLGQRARATVERDYALPRVAERHARLYREVQPAGTRQHSLVYPRVPTP